MSRRADMSNQEGIPEFDIRWSSSNGRVSSGTFSAVMRVRNEARALPWVLPGVLEAVDEVVLVDNGSDDGTAEVALETARRAGCEHRLRVFEYPFEISRCGPEHLGTPPDSVHSLTYYYNWAFSHVRTTYALKWDGDMVPTERGRRALRTLAWQLEGADRAVLFMSLFPVYIESSTVGYVDLTAHHREPWGFPNDPEFFYGKALEWEILVYPDSVQAVSFPYCTTVELKWLDSDEFAHWSDQGFEGQSRIGRKAREWEVYHSLRSGRIPKDVLRLEVSAHENIMDQLGAGDLDRQLDSATKKTPVALGALG